MGNHGSQEREDSGGMMRKSSLARRASGVAGVKRQRSGMVKRSTGSVPAETVGGDGDDAGGGGAEDSTVPPVLRKRSAPGRLGSRIQSVLRRSAKKKAVFVPVERVPDLVSTVEEEQPKQCDTPRKSIDGGSQRLQGSSSVGSALARAMKLGSGPKQEAVSAEPAQEATTSNEQKPNDEELASDLYSVRALAGSETVEGKKAEPEVTVLDDALPSGGEERKDGLAVGERLDRLKEYCSKDQLLNPSVNMQDPRLADRAESTAIAQRECSTIVMSGVEEVERGGVSAPAEIAAASANDAAHGPNESAEVPVPLGAQILRARTSLRHFTSEYLEKLSPVEPVESPVSSTIAARDKAADIEPEAKPKESTAALVGAEAEAEENLDDGGNMLEPQDAAGIPVSAEEEKNEAGERNAEIECDDTDAEAESRAERLGVGTETVSADPDAATQPVALVDGRAVAEVFDSREANVAEARSSTLKSESQSGQLSPCAALGSNEQPENQKEAEPRVDEERKSVKVEAGTDVGEKGETVMKVDDNDESAAGTQFRQDIVHARKSLKTMNGFGPKSLTSSSGNPQQVVFADLDEAEVTRQLDFNAKEGESISPMGEYNSSHGGEEKENEDEWDTLFHSEVHRSLNSLKKMELASGAVPLANVTGAAGPDGMKTDDRNERENAKREENGNRGVEFEEKPHSAKESDESASRAQNDDPIVLDSRELSVVSCGGPDVEARATGAGKLEGKLQNVDNAANEKSNGEVTLEPITREATRTETDALKNWRPQDQHLFENARLFRILEEAALAQKAEAEARDAFLCKKRSLRGVNSSPNVVAPALVL
uniref:Uncharacterized protein n=1 Tax=Erythrolobus madagascarensis TaxID=708628 RepID=A0A7S0T5X3_9RHOD